MASYIHGDFTALGFSDSEVEVLDSTVRTITDLELWNWLASWDPPADKGFAWCVPPEELKRINAANPYNDWTDGVYNWTMRNMKSIAKDGWFAWANKHGKIFQDSPPLRARSALGCDPEYHAQVATSAKYVEERQEARMEHQLRSSSFLAQIEHEKQFE
jgi:hypothetical protein